MSERLLTYRYPVPALNSLSENYTFGINVGYIEGCLDYTVPFSAELFRGSDDSAFLGVFLPVIKKYEPREMIEAGTEYRYYIHFLNAPDCDVYEVTYADSNLRKEDFSFLKIGLTSFKYKADMVTLDKYLSYIESCGLVDFKGKVRNGEISYFIDKNNNFIVYIKICLKSMGKIEAETSLKFKSMEYDDVLVAFPD